MAGDPTAPKQLVMQVDLGPCPGEGCKFKVTGTHETHCCTGCSRGLEHTNNCQGIPNGKGVGIDAHPVKLMALCCEMCS